MDTKFLLSPFMALSIGTSVLAASLVVMFLGPIALLYLLASMVFSVGLHPLGARWIQEHYTVSPPQETYSYYGPLNRVALNVGYHVEHHDFMNIPGSRLPELHAIAKEHYAPLVSHRSWTWVLWHFITGPMNLGSRIVRSRKAFDEGGKRHARAAVSHAT